MAQAHDGVSRDAGPIVLRFWGQVNEGDWFSNAVWLIVMAGPVPAIYVFLFSKS
jgi:hypothetical protein